MSIFWDRFSKIYSCLNSVAPTQKAGVQPSDEPKSCTPVLCLWRVCETEPVSLHIGTDISAREITKASSEKANTEDYFAVFQPLSTQFLERLER